MYLCEMKPLFYSLPNIYEFEVNRFFEYDLLLRVLTFHVHLVSSVLESLIKSSNIHIVLLGDKLDFGPSFDFCLDFLL